MAAGLMALMALLLSRALPDEEPRPHVAYRTLVLGSVRMLRELPELRRRAWLGAGAFAAFSVLWTTLAFELSGPPFSYSNGIIGSFGLLGAAGVVAANGAGYLADRGRTRLATVLAAFLLLGSFGLLALGGSSIIALIAGVIVLDFAVQGMQITNQSIIYALAPEARSRINSAYMVCYFAGGALGSLVAGIAYSAGSWRLSCAVGAGIALLTLLPALTQRSTS
jgi:predicted MFS family arabinose efflux permease